MITTIYFQVIFFISVKFLQNNKTAKYLYVLSIFLFNLYLFCKFFAFFVLILHHYRILFYFLATVASLPNARSEFERSIAGVNSSIVESLSALASWGLKTVRDLINTKLFDTSMILHKKVLQNRSISKNVVPKRSTQIFSNRNIQHTVLSDIYLCQYTGEISYLIFKMAY